MLKAYRYARDDAPKVGLSLEQLSAPVACVEVLARLDQLSPKSDPDFRRRVYEGRVPFAALLERERSIRRRDDAVWGAAKWPAFAAGIYPELVPHAGTVDIALLQPGKRVYSGMGRLLDVDWELQDGQAQLGIFVSPQCTFSRGRRRPLAERIVRAAAATFHYDKVFLLAWDDPEKTTIDECTAYMGRRIPVPMIVMCMAKMRFVAANQHFLRAPSPPGGPVRQGGADD